VGVTLINIIITIYFKLASYNYIIIYFNSKKKLISILKV